MTQTCKASDRAISTIRAPTASANFETSTVPAEMQHSPQHGSSARPAAESASGQNHAEAAGSRRFTPAQQAVAAALMVVVKRAMMPKHKIIYTMLTLEFNSPATRPFLMMLPKNGSLPTMKDLEQRATAQVLESLTKLASQCAAVSCQPLEVFTRSVQCDARVKKLEHGGVQRGAYEWQQQEQRRMPLAPSFLQGLAEGLQRKQWPQDMADLYVTLSQVVGLYKDDAEAASYGPSDLDHMLPGTFTPQNKIQESACELEV